MEIFCPVCGKSDKVVDYGGGEYYCENHKNIYFRVRMVNPEFDDIVEEDGSKWTQLCADHEQLIQPDACDPVPHDEIICGVKGCNKKAEYYHTL